MACNHMLADVIIISTQDVVSGEVHRLFKHSTLLSKPLENNSVL